MSNGKRHERGQSAVEFALVLPIVLLLIFGLLEFGRIVSSTLTANNCANELARYGIIRLNADGTARDETAIRNYATDPNNPACPPFSLSNESLTITVLVDYPSGQGVGDALQVDVTYPVDIVVPIIEPFFQAMSMDPYPAHGRATLQLE